MIAVSPPAMRIVIKDRKAEVEREERRGVGSDGEQRRLSERDLPGRARDQGEAQRQHPRKPGVGERLQKVGLRIDER